MLKGHLIVGKGLSKWQLIKTKEMPYKIQVMPLATMEIGEAYDWYEQQKQGLENGVFK